MFLISPHGSLAGWLWHLAEQVAGRSQGQVPHATLHDFLIIISISKSDVFVNHDIYITICIYGGY